MNNHYLMAIELIRTSKREISYYVEVFYLHHRDDGYDFKENIE